MQNSIISIELIILFRFDLLNFYNSKNDKNIEIKHRTIWIQEIPKKNRRYLLNFKKVHPIILKYFQNV